MPNRLSGGGAGGNALTAPIDWITQMFWGIISFCKYLFWLKYFKFTCIIFNQGSAFGRAALA